MPDSPEGVKLTTPNTKTGNFSSLNGSLCSSSSGGSSSGAVVGGNYSPHVNGGTPSPPSAFSVTSDVTSSSTRQIAKVKRFLATLVQFGADISPDTGDRVRALVLSVVINSLSVEEFHHALQEATNFPLRPFVLPFLRSHLPSLQRELAHSARIAKQSPQQYVRHHEHLVLDPTFSPSEASEIFHADVSETGSGSNKRRAADSLYENGMDTSEYLSTPKRPHLSSVFSPPLGPPPHAPLHTELPLPLSLHHYPFATSNPRDRDRDRDRERDREHDERRLDDEWRNIHVMLNCILSMVDKTKRALIILQQRAQSEISGGASSGGSPEFPLSGSTMGSLPLWLRRPPDGSSSEADIKRTAGEIMAQTIRATEDRVAEVKRRAEEAVNEVKRQAVLELQRAVAAAETKAVELVASERAKMEKMVSDARRQAVEEANRQADSSESCWNCGRKASETCSGCNIARYCGSFCQHRDWETHHQVCCSRGERDQREHREREREGGKIKDAPLQSRTTSRSTTPNTSAGSTSPPSVTNANFLADSNCAK